MTFQLKKALKNILPLFVQYNRQRVYNGNVQPTCKSCKRFMQMFLCLKLRNRNWEVKICEPNMKLIFCIIILSFGLCAWVCGWRCFSPHVICGRGWGKKYIYRRHTKKVCKWRKSWTKMNNYLIIRILYHDDNLFSKTFIT